MIDEATIQALEALYARLPPMECKGLCEDSCRPIRASEAEVERVLERGVNLRETNSATCIALSKTWGPGRCSVYDVRPMVCRLWGVALSMPCPHGCVPHGGHLDDETAMDLMISSMAAGGSVPELRMREALELAMSDPETKVMMGALMRGQKAVKPELGRRLQEMKKRKKR